MKHIIILLLFLPVLIFSQPTPNIIFLFADDLGHGEISRNSSTYSTPTIDSLAANGAYFSRFYARPICTASRVSFITGSYPFELSGNLDLSVHQPFDSVMVPKDTITLPENLKEYGYNTAHIGKWHLGRYKPDALQLMQGFDKTYITNPGGFRSMKPAEIDNRGIVMASSNQVETITEKFVTDQQTDSAVVYIAEQAKDTTSPFFLYYAFTNPHDHASVYGGDSIPYKQSDYDLAPVGYTATQKQKWANIKNLDDNVKRIIDTLAALGIDDNTIVIFTSDNGADDIRDADNSPFSGDKQQLQEGGVRVPFIWYHPGTIDSMVIDSLCALVDMKKTLVEGVAGGTIRGSTDGVNFYPLLEGNSIPIRYYVGASIVDRMWSVYKGSIWKLVNNNSQKVTSNTTLSDNIELFDMQNDVTESNDVSGINASVVSELQAVYDAANVQTGRTLLPSFTAPPVGWNYDPPYWTYPPMFYLTGYLYQLTQVDKE